MKQDMIQAFALIDYTQPAPNGKDGQGRGTKTPNVYFEVSSALELRAHIAGIQFGGSRVLRIYHKPGDWVLVGPLHLNSSYGTAIEQPLLSKDFASELWRCALGRLALCKQQEALLQNRGSVAVHAQARICVEQATAVILPFERTGDKIIPQGRGLVLACLQKWRPS